MHRQQRFGCVPTAQAADGNDRRRESTNPLEREKDLPSGTSPFSLIGLKREPEAEPDFRGILNVLE
jgi:hypothetical protein